MKQEKKRNTVLEIKVEEGSLSLSLSLSLAKNTFDLLI